MNRLKKLRKEKRITQTQLANYLGINQNTYSYWENDKTSIDMQNLQKLSDYFQVSVDYLLGREEEKRYFPSYEQFVKDMEKIGITEEKLAAMTPEQRHSLYSTIKALIQSFSDNKNNL